MEEKIFVEKIKKAKEILNQSDNTVALTGAGISVESGIPDFRSPQGLWEKFDPDTYANYSYFLKDPTKFWEMAFEIFPLLEKAKPNKVHYALAKLEAEGRLNTIITQNIDGLHQKAGSKKVVELHGNYSTSTCLGCRKKFRKEEIVEKMKEKIIPLCTKCGGVIKPDVVLFGERINQKTLKKAQQLAQEAEVFLIVGTSLEVYPAAFLPKIVKRGGGKIIIIDPHKKPEFEKLGLYLQRDASKILPLLAE